MHQLPVYQGFCGARLTCPRWKVEPVLTLTLTGPVAKKPGAVIVTLYWPAGTLDKRKLPPLSAVAQPVIPFKQIRAPDTLGCQISEPSTTWPSIEPAAVPVVGVGVAYCWNVWLELRTSTRRVRTASGCVTAQHDEKELIPQFEYCEPCENP